jgi:hypothetical protein
MYEGLGHLGTYSGMHSLLYLEALWYTDGINESTQGKNGFFETAELAGGFGKKKTSTECDS